MGCTSVRAKKSSIDRLKSDNAVIHHLSERMRFSYFSVLPGSAAAILKKTGNKTANINVKKLQFIHTVNGDGSKTAKIIKRQC